MVTLYVRFCSQTLKLGLINMGKGFIRREYAHKICFSFLPDIITEASVEDL